MKLNGMCEGTRLTEYSRCCWMNQFYGIKRMYISIHRWTSCGNPKSQPTSAGITSTRFSFVTHRSEHLYKIILQLESSIRTHESSVNMKCFNKIKFSNNNNMFFIYIHVDWVSRIIAELRKRRKVRYEEIRVVESRVFSSETFPLHGTCEALSLSLSSFPKLSSRKAFKKRIHFREEKLRFQKAVGNNRRLESFLKVIARYWAPQPLFASVYWDSQMLAFGSISNLIVCMNVCKHNPVEPFFSSKTKGTNTYV